MRIEQTDDEITIRETPGCVWLFGLFFAVIGAIFVYGGLGGFNNSRDAPRWQLALAIVFGMTGVGVGIWQIMRSPVLFVRLNRLNETVTIARRGLFSRAVKSLHFNEINSFFLQSDTDDEGSPTWRFALRLENGDEEALTTVASYSEEFERRYVFTVNEFMNKQLPATTLILEAPDEETGEMS